MVLLSKKIMPQIQTLLKKPLTGKQTQNIYANCFVRSMKSKFSILLKSSNLFFTGNCLFEADAKISRGRILCCWGHMRLPEVL